MLQTREVAGKPHFRLRFSLRVPFILAAVLAAFLATKVTIDGIHMLEDAVPGLKIESSRR